jgi:two-component system nitrate/nitrite response regulator NarL
MSTSGAKVSVVVADDHPIYREGITRGLSLTGQVQILAEAADGVEALDLIRLHKPQVAVIDYYLPHLNGIEVVHAVVRDRLPTRVIILSATTDSAVVFRAIEEGVQGYLAKDASRADIAAAVMKVSKGGSIIPADLASGLVNEIRMRVDAEATPLTERERQVLQGFAAGKSVPQLAAELFLANSTVKTHVQRLYDKLGVSDRAAAVAEAMRRRLLE